MPKTNSDDLLFRGFKILIGGKTKVGKTYMAATISEKFESKVLDDVYWMSFDEGSTRGLSEAGFTIPHVWDFSVIPDEALHAELGDCIGDISRLVKSGAVSTVVVDTVSKFGKQAKSYAETTGKDTRQQWGEVLRSHWGLVKSLNQVGCNVIYLTHHKEDAPESTDTTSKKAQRLATAPSVDVILDISGQGANLYRGDCDIIGVLTCAKLKGKEAVRKFYPHGKPGIEGGSRFACLSEEGEPADLRKLINKIKEKVKTK